MFTSAAGAATVDKPARLSVDNKDTVSVSQSSSDGEDYSLQEYWDARYKMYLECCQSLWLCYRVHLMRVEACV